MIEEEFLVEVFYVSIDPQMRRWISTVSNYSEPVAFDQPMRSFGVGNIISTKNIDFKVGEFVVGWLVWQKYSIVKFENIKMTIPENDVPLSANQGVLGLNGITAYVGLVDICKPKKGDTVVVTTVAGSVGSAVRQITKIFGCKIIGHTSQ